MLGKYKLFVDTFSNVYNALSEFIDAEFWDFSKIDINTPGVYIISRHHFFNNIGLIKDYIVKSDFTFVLDNSSEGSNTLIDQLKQYDVDELAKSRKFLIISGAELPSEYRYVVYEHLVRCIFDYDINLSAINDTSFIFNSLHKPYKFLFLNGRNRPHRKFLLEKFKQFGILDSALWSMLDNRHWPNTSNLSLVDINGVDLMKTNTSIKLLPDEYECLQYRNERNSIQIKNSQQRQFIKDILFRNEWGEIYIEPKQYINSYFSVVTETVFDSDCSFLTEKIAKPLAIGHPFIVAGNTGFYKTLHRYGFKTFGALIDESFDSIENAQDRLTRVALAVNDLCNSDLNAFIKSAKDICIYNQQHLKELSIEIKHMFPKKLTEMFNLKAQNDI